MNELKSSNEVSILLAVNHQQMSKELSSLKENYVVQLCIPNKQKILVEKNENAEMQISTLTQEKTTLFVRVLVIVDSQSSVNNELRQQAEKNDELLVGQLIRFNFVEGEKRRVGITKEESGGAEGALGQGESDDR